MTTPDALYSALTHKPSRPQLNADDVERLGSVEPATQYATPGARQVSLAGQTARRVRLAQRFLPTDDPTEASLYYHIATSPQYADDRAYMDAIANAGGFSKARQYVRFFKRFGPGTSDMEWAGAGHVWDDLSERQQGYLKAMGVMDPRERRGHMEAQDGGLVGNLMGDIWDVAGTPVKKAGALAGEGLSMGLEALGKPQSIVNTGYRYLSLTVGKTPEGDNFIESLGTLTPAAIWNRAKYARDVAGEGHGERAVHMVDRDRALDILGGNEHLLNHALDAMVSGDPTAIALQMTQSRAKARGFNRQSDPDAFQSTFEEALEVVRSKKFMRAVSTLQAGKVSPGRDFVRSVLQPGDGEFTIPGVGQMNLHQLASGIVDATWTIYTDPILIGGKIAKAARAGYAAQSVDEVSTFLRASEKQGRAWQAGNKMIRDADAGYDDIIKMAADPNHRKASIAFARDQAGLTPQEMWANDFRYALGPGPNRAARLGALTKLHMKETAFLDTAVQGHLRKLGWLDNTPVGLDEIANSSEDIGRLLGGTIEEAAEARRMISEIQVGQQTALRTNEGIATEEGFEEFMREGQGLMGVLGGETTSGTSASIVWPKLTKRSEFNLRAKLRFEDRLTEWQKLGGWKEYAKGVPLPPGVVPPARAQGVDRIKAGVAQFVTGVTQQVPTDAAVGAFGPNSGKNLSQWLRFSMPYDDTYKWIGEFYDQANAAGRRIIAHQAVADGLTRFGLRETQFYEMWTSGLDTIGAARSLVYDINPRNSTIILGDGSRVPAALFKSQLADNYLALPSLREMTKALPKLGAYRDLMTGRSTMRALDTGLVDSAVNRFWKPLVLLRLGFIPRAIGEETLAWFAREPGELAKSWLAYPFHYPERWEGEVAAPMRWIARAERRFNHFNYRTEYDRIFEMKELARQGGAYPGEEAVGFLKKHVVDYRTEIYDKELKRYKKVPFFAKGSAYNTGKGGTAIRKKPLYFFDPADVRGTLKLQGYIKNMTGRMLDEYDQMALNAITDQEAIIRAHMQMVVGGDHYNFPSYAETKGSRGQVLLGAPPLAGQRHVPMTGDMSRFYTHDAADDPLIDMAHDTVNLQGSLDDGIRVPVQHAVTGYIPPPIHAQLDTILSGGSRRTVAETTNAFGRAPRPLQDDFDELASISSARGSEAAIQAEIELRNRIAKQISKIDDAKDRDALQNLFAKWDTPGFDFELKSAVIQRRQGLYAGLDPTLPDDARRIRLLDEAFDSTDARVAEEAHNALLRDTVRADLLSPNAQLDEFERAQLVGGRSVVGPSTPGHHKVWFPMMGRGDADEIAARISAGPVVEQRYMLESYNWRKSVEPEGQNPGDFVPFGYWGHDDPRKAAEWAQRLTRDEVPYTIGYMEIRDEWMPKFRSAADPAGEYRGIQAPLWGPSNIKMAPTVDDVVMVGERERAHAVAAASHEYGLVDEAARMSDELGVKVEVIPPRAEAGVPEAALPRAVGKPHTIDDDFATWLYYDEQLNYVTPEHEMLFEPEIGQTEARRGRSEAAERLADQGYDMDYEFDVERLKDRFGSQPRRPAVGPAERPKPVRPVFEGEEAAAATPEWAPHQGPREVRGGFSTRGRGTPAGDAKDAAMREEADSAIVELSASERPSSSRTTLNELGAPTEQSEVVMLARNGSLKGIPLDQNTRRAMGEAHNRGARFVVGDMPGVDEPFIKELDRMGADYTVFHGGDRPRIALRSPVRGEARHLEQQGEALRSLGYETKEQAVGQASEEELAALAKYGRLQRQVESYYSPELHQQVDEAYAEYQRLVDLRRPTAPKPQRASTHMPVEVVEHQGLPTPTVTPTPAVVDYGVGATYDEMIESMVNDRVEGIKNRYMTHPDDDVRGISTPRYGIARPVGEGNWQTKYLSVEGVSKPTKQIGPSLSYANRNLWDDFVRWGFDRVIAPAIDTVVRRPMFISSMAKAYRQAETVTGGALHAPMVTKIQIPTVNEEGVTTLVDHTVDIAGLAKRFGFTKKVGKRTVADIDAFHRTLAPTLRWARDAGMPVNSVEDLEKVIMRRAADLNTEGITDITNATRRMLNDMRAKGGAETLTDHPIGRILGGVTEDRRVIINRRPPGTKRLFETEGGGWSMKHPEEPVEGSRFVDVSEARLKPYLDERGRLKRALPDEITTHAETAKIAPVKHVDTGPPGIGLEDAKARGDVAEAVELADEEIRALNKWFLSEDDARNQLAKIAGSRAFNENIRFIDDHSIRSQYAENVRNLVPFYFAEEQFLKRWARTIAYDPAGIRRVQLLKHGLDSIGFIKKDPQTGADYFEYPFSAELNEVLGKVSNMVFGGEHTLPIFVPLTGQVRYALPGLDNKGLPQVGPVVSIPVKALANRFPELRDAEYTILGSRAAGLPMSSQVVPASVSRFWQAFTASPDRSREMASTMAAVVQLMEAEGLTPPDSAGAKEREQYMDRVENWSRTMMLSRAILGFSGPAAPSADVPGKEMSVEFRELLKELPIGEAAAAFISANPDATPFTVFRSKSTSGAPLPTGKRTLDWMEKNQDLITTYPMGAPWLIPQEYADDDYESQSYNQQLALGIRERRLPEEMYDEIKFAKASPMYFDTRDEYQKRITIAKASGNSAQSNALEEEYGRWRASYLAQNPLFAEQLSAPTARQRRLNVLDQLSEMAEDPRLSRGQRIAPAIRYVLDAWNSYDAAYNVLRYDRSKTATMQRQQLKVNMFNHLESYTRENREARALYLRVIRPELEVDAGVTP